MPVATTQVWTTWTSGTTTSSLTYANDPWNNWVGTNATTTTVANTVWVNWQTIPATQTHYYVPQVSEEERERREVEIAERRARAEEFRKLAAKEKVEAEARAAELLRLILTDEQWAAYEERREFYVIAGSGRRYLIKHGLHGNVKVVEDDVVVESLCIQPPTGEYDEEHRYREIPVADALVAQVLGIRHDEESFRRVANITRVHRPMAVAQ